MSYSLSGNSITMTRGDTFNCIVSAFYPNGAPYEPKPGDTIRFAMKRTYEDAEPLLLVDIPIETMELTINADDTKDLGFGSYIFDVQLTTANGFVDTFITRGRLRLTEEVD